MKNNSINDMDKYQLKKVSECINVLKGVKEFEHIVNTEAIKDLNTKLSKREFYDIPKHPDKKKLDKLVKKLSVLLNKYTINDEYYIPIKFGKKTIDIPIILDFVPTVDTSNDASIFIYYELYDTDFDTIKIIPEEDLDEALREACKPVLDKINEIFNEHNIMYERLDIVRDMLGEY